MSLGICFVSWAPNLRGGGLFIKNLLMPLFLMGCFPLDFQEVKRPLRTKSGKRPTKVGKRPIKEGKRPIKAMVLLGISIGCLMGCFRAPPPWRKTALLKRPIKRSMSSGCFFFVGAGQLGSYASGVDRVLTGKELLDPLLGRPHLAGADFFSSSKEGHLIFFGYS